MANQREILLCKYHYDALDQLTSNELSGEPERQRFYCKSRLATEIQGANRFSVFQHDDQLLAQQQSEGDAFDATLLATDQQRSVLHTLRANHPRQSITYSPYGHRPTEHGLLSLLGFNGERPDLVTGNYLLGNGYRTFNRVLMRFNSPDSWSPFGKGGLNSYMYCLGDPVSRIDQTGHFSSVIIKRISAWKSQAKYAIRTKLVTSGKLKPKWNSRSFQSLYDRAIDVLARNPSALQLQETPKVIAEQIIQKMSISKKANSIEFPRHSMQSRTIEKLANNRELTATPEGTIGLFESSNTRYSLYSELRSALRPDDEPRIILSRVRDEARRRNRSAGTWIHDTNLL